MTVNEQFVWLTLKKMIGAQEEDKEKYFNFCAIASTEIGAIIEDEKAGDLAVISSAFLALYYYCVINNIDQPGEVSFSAGDITVKSDGGCDAVDSLKVTAYSLISDYISTGSHFYFGAV